MLILLCLVLLGLETTMNGTKSPPVCTTSWVDGGGLNTTERSPSETPRAAPVSVNWPSSRYTRTSDWRPNTAVFWRGKKKFKNQRPLGWCHLNTDHLYFTVLTLTIQVYFYPDIFGRWALISIRSVTWCHRGVSSPAANIDRATTCPSAWPLLQDSDPLISVTSGDTSVEVGSSWRGKNTPGMCIPGEWGVCEDNMTNWLYIVQSCAVL